MDKIAAAIQYVVTHCALCGQEIAVSADMADEIFLCASCDRPIATTRLTEDVLPIECDCE
jgi:hypothetical protein